MQNEKVLLIGTSFSAVPLLQFLKQSNYHVSVCGGLKNDPCHSYADSSYFIDYSNKKKLLELCQNENFDFLVPSCNDYAYNSASYVATKLNKFFGFDHWDKTNLLHTKSGFRNFTLKNNLSVPRAIEYSKSIDTNNLDLTFPLLIKPDDSFSGKGVTKVVDKRLLKEAIDIAEKNSKNGKVIIEEFVEGNLYSHSAFIQDGKILIDFFVSEYCTVYPYQVDSSSLSYSLKDDIKEKVRKEIEILASLLELNDGLIHTQFISDNNKLGLIETMRRCPGDLYGTLIKKSTGFNYSEFYSNPFLNKKNKIKNLKLYNKYFLRHTISTSKDIIFQSFNYNIPAKKVHIIPLKESGHILCKAPFDKLGLVFCEFENKKELIEYTPKVKNYFWVDDISEAVYG